MIKKNKIKIKLNGKNYSLSSNLSVNDLTIKLKIPINKVAIELNREIVNKKRISKIILKSEDKIEIVNFIGGG